MARIKSIKELGKGAWKIASISPIRQKPTKLFDYKSGNDPQSKLFRAVKQRWPHAVAEHPAGVPGRKFRIDIAFVEAGLAAEIDGYAYHAKFLKDFKKDRNRQNLLVLHGWRVLRFTAGEIHKDLDGCLSLIEECLNNGIKPIKLI